MYPLICPLLNLAAFLEIGDCNNSTKLFGPCSKQSFSNIFERKILNPLFRLYQSCQLGTHSICKGAATFASWYGFPKVRIIVCIIVFSQRFLHSFTLLCHHWVNIIGCWREKKQQVDTYIDINLPYPDACCASVLCSPQ